ncbi:MAG TPA: hypothetical protein VNF99_08530 [Stellaceae bacterium]|nr:hypothetical protein [Stellaceae bacterium]
MPGLRSLAVALPGRIIGAALGAFGATAAGLAFLPPARADFELHYPIIDYRELELEHNADTTFDQPKSGKNNNQSYTIELGYAPVPWWEPEIEGDLNAAPGQNLSYSATTFENTFQLTEQGKYWADLGFFAEYSHVASKADADDIVFGPLIQKQMPDIFGVDLGHDTLHTLNLLVTKEVGRNRNDATPLAIAWQTRIRINPYFEPGFEYYGALSSIAGVSTGQPQQHRLGPALVGEYNLFQYGKIKYEAGYLFGLNRATERGTLRWRFEYEKAF